MAPTKVNESVVRAFMLREVKSRKIKPHHWCAILTWGLHFYWLPTGDEIEAMDQTTATQYNDAAGEYKKTTYTKRILNLPGWLPFNRVKAFNLEEKNA